MRILLTGASGFVGAHLTHAFVKQGIEVDSLTRNKNYTHHWDPTLGTFRCPHTHYDALIHLAGESIRGRWTDNKKARILQSRLRGIETITQAITTKAVVPKMVIVASAIGYYGNTGQAWVDENAPQGSGFAAQVCAELEQVATNRMSSSNMRTVCARFGLVLGTEGGALASMLPAFRFGAGGIIDQGTQYMSWVTLDQLTDMLLFTVNTAALTGAINYVTPTAVTNSEFTHALCHALGTKPRLPIPAWLVRLLFGQMGKELLLCSSRVQPQRLIDAGYQFDRTSLQEVLTDLVNSKR